MFIYSLRASTIKFYAIICVALVGLIALVVFIPPTLAGGGVAPTSGSVDAAEYRYDKIKTPEDRVSFLSQFGWTVNSTPEDSSEVTIPTEFDKIYSAYNQIQKNQGLDLTKYKNKKVMRYTYEITNYPDYTGTVYANVLVYRGKVIGGDICSADAGGFIHGFEKERSGN